MTYSPNSRLAALLRLIDSIVRAGSWLLELPGRTAHLLTRPYMRRHDPAPGRHSAARIPAGRAVRCLPARLEDRLVSLPDSLMSDDEFLFDRYVDRPAASNYERTDEHPVVSLGSLLEGRTVELPKVATGDGPAVGEHFAELPVGHDRALVTA